MEQITITSSTGVNPMLLQKQGKEAQVEGDTTAFAMLLQGLTIMNNQEVLELAKGSSEEGESLKSLLANIHKILESSDTDSLEALMIWFNGLSFNEQQKVQQLLNNFLQADNMASLPFLKGDSNSTQLLLNNEQALSVFLEKVNKTLENINLKKQTIFSRELLQESDSSKLVNKDSTTVINRNQTLMMNQLPKFRIDNNFNYQGSPEQLDMEPKNVELTQLQLQHLNTNLTDFKAVAALGKQQLLENVTVNQNFASELGKVLIKNFQLPNGATETKIQLHPQELGQIDVKLIANNGQITAQLIAKTLVGKELLEAQLHQLKQSLISQGYQIERIEVQQASSSSSNFGSELKNGFDFSGQQSAKQHGKQQGNTSHKDSFSEEAVDFTQQIHNLSGIDYTA